MSRRTPKHKWGWLALGLCCVLVVLVYTPALDGAYVFDDIPLLAGQDCWRGLGHIPTILGLEGSAGKCSYRPIRYVSFALDYSVGGLDPSVNHWFNLGYHLLTLLLVYLVLVRLGFRPLVAALVGCVWALHPVQTDAVAYISGRRDLLTGLFFLLSFLPLIKLTRREGRPNTPLTLTDLTLSLIFFWLAFQSKEMAITLPIIAIWYVFCARPSFFLKHVRANYLLYVALLALGLIFFLQRGVWDSHSHQDSWWGGSVVSNFSTVLALVPRYLELLIWPSRLVGDYHENTIAIAGGPTDLRTILGAVVLLSWATAIWISLKRGWDRTAFGLGWFLITMLPVAHIIPHHELLAEHYLYLPTVGLGIVLASGVERIWTVREQHPRRARMLLVGLLIVGAAFGARTHVRCYDWETELSFNLAAYRHAPDNQRVLYTIAVIYAE